MEDVPLAERAYLKILKADGKGEIIELGSLGVNEAVIGRSLDCEIRLGVDSVSRKHARVALRNEEYHIEDMNSTNGVYVNGVKVVKCVLRDNDQIEIGGVKIIFNEEKTLKGRS
jgi:pSer/pThr/pTyr-binding forkhead associated (FHA) protein